MGNPGNQRDNEPGISKLIDKFSHSFDIINIQIIWNFLNMKTNVFENKVIQLLSHTIKSLYADVAGYLNWFMYDEDIAEALAD